MANAVHACRKVLPPALIALGGGSSSRPEAFLPPKGPGGCSFSWQPLRWRLALKYELVNVGHHRVTVRNGPFGEVSQRYMGAVLKEYLEQLIYSIKLLDNRIQ